MLAAAKGAVDWTTVAWRTTSKYSSSDLHVTMLNCPMLEIATMMPCIALVPSSLRGRTARW